MGCDFDGVVIAPHAPLPRVLWVELTSKCPFDCIFCSRRMRRGGGIHMPMPLYRRLIAELQAPEIIRLNYSGESTHHPDFIEAIRLAAATDAFTELVTALASLPVRLLEPLVSSGLDRLTVSLHTLDEAQYRAIYGHGSVADVRLRLDGLRAAAARRGRPGPAVDLAVVAMRRNLDQLLPLAGFAKEIGATGLAVHPVIRRDPVAEPFSEELEGDRLRPTFLAELKAALDAVQQRFPDLTISVSTPELADQACLGARPLSLYGPLPTEARIHSCEQNPWETVHVLADGSVVTCEVRDRIVLGRIRIEGPGIAEIWSGPEYTAFRARYQAGEVPECRACPYKIAYLPGPPQSAIDAAVGSHAQLRFGWHLPDGSGLLWAKRHAALVLARPSGSTLLHIEGVIPGGAGEVSVIVDGMRLGRLGFGRDENEWLAADFGLAPGGAVLTLELAAERKFVPVRAGTSPDVRELGFGLQRVAVR